MYHFYTEASNIFTDRIILTGSDVNHIKNVLRMHEGEEIIICDGEGTDHYCRLSSIGQEEITASIIESRATSSELPVKLYLFQGLPKKDKMELIIQKAVELGVCEIVPVMTKRVIVKLDDDKKEAKKLERWQAISESAAKQSGRGIIPKINRVLSFKEALSYASEIDKKLIPYENADAGANGMERSRELVRSVTGQKSACVFIGPEGGFEENEVQEAIKAGFEPISLGKRILRTETAGLAALSVIMFEIDR